MIWQVLAYLGAPGRNVAHLVGMVGMKETPTGWPRSDVLRVYPIGIPIRRLMSHRGLFGAFKGVLGRT